MPLNYLTFEKNGAIEIQHNNKLEYANSDVYVAISDESADSRLLVHSSCDSCIFQTMLAASAPFPSNQSSFLLRVVVSRRIYTVRAW